MSYIQPNSIIQLFQGINLDNRYLHTIYFANESAQNSWFTGKVYKSYQQQSYTRYGVNQVKIKDDVTNLFGCTYLRFKNDRSVDKWFYAFITSVEYINENVALITYEIDVMQTWFIQDGGLRPCMVLREHASTDVFGDNLEAEPMGSDTYDSDEIFKFGDNNTTNEFSRYDLVAQTTALAAQDQHIKQGLFTGCNYYSHELREGHLYDDSNDAYNDLALMLGSWTLQQQQEQVVDLYTVPHFCTDVNTGHLSTGDNIKIPSSYDNYTPKNKKLFMYPYSYLMVTTHMGDTAIYRWEYFEGTSGADCEFEVDGTMLGGGEIRCFPRSYNGQSDNVDAGLVMGNFPKNTYAYDAYQAWIAGGGSTRLENERVVNSFKGVGSVLQGIAGLVGIVAPQTSSTLRESQSTDVGTFLGQPFVNQNNSASLTTYNKGVNIGGGLGAVGGAVSGVGGLVEARNNLQYEFNDAAYAPNIVVGKATSSLPVAMRDANLYFFHCHVRDDEVKRLDDFLSCYGYATNRVKQPNLTGRAYWNFVQTQNAVITGNMPSSSKEAIGRIFDSGITFWHNGDQVGNYRQSVSNGTINNPIS